MAPRGSTWNHHPTTVTSALLLALLMTTAAPAAEDTFVEAKRTYAALRADKARRTQRVHYEKLVRQLVKASGQATGRPAECAYLAATIAEDLYNASGVAADLDQAVELNVAVADRFKDNSLADDALLRAARLQVGRRGDIDNARTLLVRAQKNYPQGDQLRAIKELLARLPEPTPPPAPAEEKAPVRPAAEPAARPTVEDILARFNDANGPDAGAPDAAAPVAIAAAPTPAPAAEPERAAPPPVTPEEHGPALPVKKTTIKTHAARTEVTLYTASAVIAREGTAVASGKLPARYFVDVTPARTGSVASALKAHKDARIMGIRVAQYDEKTVRIVFDLAREVPGNVRFDATALQLLITVGEPVTAPTQVAAADVVQPAPEEKPAPAAEKPAPVVEKPTPAAEKPAAVAATVPDAGPTLSEVKSLARELDAGPAVSLSAQAGLKVRRVVIDAGHGGDDPGAIGPTGVKEKDVTLKVARKVAERLRKELKMEVILTRDKDVFIPLEGRTQIANEKHADLFISIHCNSHPNRRIYGVETYYLNITDDNYAIRLAARENKTSEKSISDLQFILADLAMKSNVDDSARLSRLVQANVVGELRESYSGVKDLGVKHALFYVLIGAKMPAILLETSFVSNKTEEQRLGSSRYQDRLADGVVQGVRNFVEERQALAR